MIGHPSVGAEAATEAAPSLGWGSVGAGAATEARFDGMTHVAFA